MEEHSIFLLHVESCFGLVQESHLTCVTERDSDCHILMSTHFRAVSSAIMVKWFPIVRITIPVESSFHLSCLHNLEVFTHLVHDCLIRWTVLWILANQVASFIPGDPLAPLLTRILQTTHFFDQLVVRAPIFFFTAERRHDDDIIMFAWLWIMSHPRPHYDSHGRPNEGLNCRTFVNEHGLAFSGVIILLGEVFIFVAIVDVLDTFLPLIRQEQWVFLSFWWLFVSRSEHVSKLRIRDMFFFVKLVPWIGQSICSCSPSIPWVCDFPFWPPLALFLVSPVSLLGHDFSSKLVVWFIVFSRPRPRSSSESLTTSLHWTPLFLF